MLTFLQGTNVNICVPLINGDGEDLIDVSKVTWKLFDEEEKLLTSGDSADFDDEVATISVPAKYNLVSDEVDSEVHLLLVTLTCDNDQSFNHKFYYVLQSDEILKVGKNSTLTYMQALKLTPSLSNLVSWGRSTEAQQKSALLNAYINLSRLSLIRGAAGDEADYESFRVNGRAPSTIADFPESALKFFPKRFQSDFQIAQMQEAEFLLGTDSVEQLRHKGVMSYTVGEVKQFYRTSTPLELGCSKEALRYVGRYLQYNRSIGRA